MPENKAMADNEAASVESGNRENNGTTMATSIVLTDNDLSNVVFLPLTTDEWTAVPDAASPASTPEDVPRANSLPAEVVSRPEIQRATSVGSSPLAVVSGGDVKKILMEPAIPVDFLEDAENVPEVVNPRELEPAASEPDIMKFLCGTSVPESEVAEKLPGKSGSQRAGGNVGKTPAGSSGVTGLAKRKPSKNVSPSEKNSRAHGPHSDSENPISFGKPQKRGRRCRIVSDDEDGEDKRILADAQLLAAAVSPGKQPGSPPGSDLPLSGRKTRSCRKLSTTDNIVVTLLDSSDDDFNLSFADSSVITIKESIIGWMNSIEQLRFKSKNLQGSISGRIRELIKKAKEGLDHGGEIGAILRCGISKDAE